MIKVDIIEILDNILEKKKYSNIELNYYFNKKEYSTKEKAFIKNLLTITIKNLIYIDYIISKFSKKISKKNILHLLRISTAQIVFTNADNKGVVYEANEIAKEINIYQAKFVNSVLKNIIKDIDKIDKEIDEKEKWDIKYSYTKEMYNKLKADYPQDYLDIMKSYKNKAYLSIRPNKNNISKDEFYNKIKEYVVHNVEDVYYISNPNILEQLNEKDYFIQDASSYIVAKNIFAKEGEIILDACSSPGGKSACILSLYSPKELIATDIYDHKIKILNDIKDKYNFSNMTVEKKDAMYDNNFSYNHFDKILLDVPCSGLGVLRRKPEKVYNISISDIKAIKKIQKKILENNIKYLKIGGEIVYSTCTITKNENTNNIKSFLEKHQNFEVVETYIPEGVIYNKDELGGVYISYKNEYLDGFYIIKLKKIKE